MTLLNLISSIGSAINVALETITVNDYYIVTMEVKGDIQFYFVIITFCFEVFQKYSNSNSIFYPSVQYLAAKILYLHPSWKHVASVHSKGQLTLCASFQ